MNVVVYSLLAFALTAAIAYLVVGVIVLINRLVGASGSKDGEGGGD